MARVFVTRQLPGGALDRLGAAHEVEVWAERMPPEPPQLRDKTAAAEALLTLLTDAVDASLMESAPRLKAISNYAVGTDNVDLPAATARGIPVGNTPDVLTEATADLTLALILAAARRITEGDRYVRAGEWRTWEPGLLLGHDLSGATVGIVGHGRIGRAVGRRLQGFGCELIYTSRGSDAPLTELLERADFVTLHAPLTDDSRHLIGAAELKRMKPTAHLVNTARGPLVDSHALARALAAGVLAGAALDVTDPEPLPGDHPLLDAPNLTVLPHLGSATHSAREAMAERAVDNLLATLSGERMPFCANPEVYEERATRPAP